MQKMLWDLLPDLCWRSGQQTTPDKRMDGSWLKRVPRPIIEAKSTVKYLGLAINSKLRFFEQIIVAADNFAAGVSALSQLMTNIPNILSYECNAQRYGLMIWARTCIGSIFRKYSASPKWEDSMRCLFLKNDNIHWVATLLAKRDERQMDWGGMGSSILTNGYHRGSYV